LGFRTHIKNFIIIISFDAVDYLAVGGLTEWAAGGDLRPPENCIRRLWEPLNSSVSSHYSNYIKVKRQELERLKVIALCRL
jgi:hypothetical protein